MITVAVDVTIFVAGVLFFRDGDDCVAGTDLMAGIILDDVVVVVFEEKKLVGPITTSHR